MLLASLLTACTESPTNVQQVDELPPLYPDYVDVTVPLKIAPMVFDIDAEGYECMDVTIKGENRGELHFNGDIMELDIEDWHNLLAENAGKQIVFTVCAKINGQWYQYKDFRMKVSNKEFDVPNLSYRRIAPGYEAFSEMGLYSRDLTTFDEYEIMSNTRMPGNCVNCHTSNPANLNQTLYHVRGEKPVTVVKNGSGSYKLLSTSTPATIGLCVYPYWHPEGRYVAFSTNTTRQSFHVVKDERIEVFDQESDLQILDTETNELVLSPSVMRTDSWETYPTFSPDGKTLYFCTAEPKDYPQDFKEVKYRLCKASFDSKTGKIGEQIDTLINNGKSITFPRISPDGKWLMYTQSDYGCFPIWHKEADLYLLNLATGKSHAIKEVNSDDVDSFHNWEPKSSWFVFSSRRGDGLYTRLYLSCLDENGKATKPFLLPQINPKHYYERLLHSYNAPEFSNLNNSSNAKEIADDVVEGKSINVGVK